MCLFSFLAFHFGQSNKGVRSQKLTANMSGVLQLTCIIISIVTVSQGIGIEHCYGSQSSSLSKEPSCDEGLQGSLMFHIGRISSFRTQLTSVSKTPLLVVCEWDEPIQLRLNLPRVEVYVPPGIQDLYQGFMIFLHYQPPDIKTWSSTGSFVRYTSEKNVSYVQWIKFESLKFFSGIVRCESKSEKTTWTQLFVAPSTYPVFFHLSNPTNFFVPQIATNNSSIVVPCIGANSSDPGTRNIQLYTRPLSHTFYTKEMNRSCIAALCDLMDHTVVPEFGPFRDIMGRPPMGAQCRDYIKKSTVDVDDCNLDAIISCADALAYFPKLRDVCETQNGLFEEGVAYTTLILNYESLRDEENVKRVRDAVYNDSLGFVVPNASWDYEREYLCSIDPFDLTTHDRIVPGFIPLDSRKELNVTVDIIGNELSCDIDQLPLKHILRKRQTQFWMMDCHSLPDCDFQFRPNMGLGQPTMTSKRKDNNLVVSVDAEQASRIQRKLSLRLPLEFKNGLVGCTGIFITNGTAPFYVQTFRYLFSGLDKQPHFTDQVLPSNSLIQLMGENNVVGEDQVFSCRFSAFHFHSTCIFTIENANGRKKFESTDLKKVKETGGKMTEERLDGIWQRTLKFQLKSGDYRVRCSALRLDKGSWDQAYISIQVLDALSVGVKVWISLAVILFLLLLILAVYLMIKNRRAQKMIRKLTPEEIEIFLRGGLKDFDASPDSSPSSMDVDNIGFPTELQINSSSLSIFLGEGEFGKCVLGEWKCMAVAVKSPKPSADLDYFRAFLREIKIMGYVGDHRNVVKLHGAVVDDLKNGQCFAVLELSPCGNLLHLLREYSVVSGHVKDLYVNAGPSSIPPILTPALMASFSSQIATGMEFLSEKKVIHGDLAARNVLLYADLTLKITDFGLSRKLYNYSMYAKKSATMLPWRWMAFESLKHLDFSLLSDVWAFGVTIWEIYSLGQIPYGGLNWNDEFLKELEDGRRPPKPAHANKKVYKLMLDCWALLPVDRPTMSQVKAFFQGSVMEDNPKVLPQNTSVAHA